jgi:hypothetical protein
MEISQILTGSCLCGSVAYELRGPFMEFVNCYCSRCRKASGSAYAANATVSPDSFRWIRGEDLVGRYDLPQARSFSISFCRQCGSQLPHHTRSGSTVIIPAGSLDSDLRVGPTKNIHWQSRAPWASPPADLPTSE